MDSMKGMEQYKDTSRIKISKTYLFCKRLFDIVCGLIGFAVLLPLIIIVKICTLASGDKESIFFTQSRIGQNGKEFKFYKFRSMVPNADEVLFKKLEEETRAIHAELVSSKELELSSVKTRMGKTTIEIENISKSIKGETLFKNFSYNVKKFDRLGIVGENGAGKTTLFKSILGLIPVDFGTITIGKTINIGYFAQEMPDFNKNIKMIDYLKSFGEYVETINGKLSASQMLENYLFPPSIQQQQLCRLSGGEKRRLQLLTVLMKNPNVLFLDEPTNDLDVYTLEILENYLESFMGAVIVVSHDRYFLDKVADHLLVLENNEIKEYNGIVSDYISQNPKVSIEKEKNKKEVLNIPRFTSQEKKEFDNIENVIEEIENKIKLLKEEQIVYSTDYQKLIELNEQIEELEILLLEKLERWEYLNNINEQIIEYRNNKYK